MRVLVAGILGGIVMFVWTSIAHMALPLGEAGIDEIPNESAVLGAMQSNIGDKTGLYIFPGLGVGKNAAREEKNEAMKQMQQKNSREPIRYSHRSSAGAAVRIWQIARHRIQNRSAPGNSGDLAIGTDAHWQLCWPSRFRFGCRNSGRDNNQCFVLELVRLPSRLQRQLYAHRD
jgi:hypothetical protein